MRFSRAVLVVMMLAGGAAALAQPEPGERHPMPPRGERGDMMAKLNLNDKQKAEMTKMRADMQKAMVGIQAKIKIARIDLRTLVSADPPDRSTVQGKIKEISDLQYQAKKMMVDHLFDAYALLTPEQQKTFRGMMMMRLSEGGRGPMMQHRWQGFRGGEE